MNCKSASTMPLHGEISVEIGKDDRPSVQLNTIISRDCVQPSFVPEHKEITPGSVNMYIPVNITDSPLVRDKTYMYMKDLSKPKLSKSFQTILENNIPAEHANTLTAQCNASRGTEDRATPLVSEDPSPHVPSKFPNVSNYDRPAHKLHTLSESSQILD